MLMQKLAELYDRVKDEVVPAGYKHHSVEWFIQLDEDGRYAGFVPTEGDEGPLEAPLPYRKRGGTKPPPYLLVDKPAYVLGLGLGDLTPEKAVARHEAFVELVRECADACGHPAVEAVARFLEQDIHTAREDAPEELRPSHLIGFMVGTTRTFALRGAADFWTDKVTADLVERADLECECLLCGRVKSVIKRHPIELQVGPDRAGLITANENAFESFGLNASEIAPVCLECACAYGLALRHLLDSPAHSFATAGGTYVFWTREPTEFNPWQFVSQADPEEVQRLLKTPWGRGGVPEMEPNEFYALCVSSNQSRMVVRSWLHTTVGQVKENLAAYFRAQRIVGPDGSDAPYPINTLILSLVRRFDDLSPQVVPALLEFALTGRPLPTYLLHQAVQRARADTDNRMTRPRAAIMRMVLESQRSTQKEGLTVSPELDPQNAHPAYVSGRLLAVLEEVQRRAIPGVKATLVDKYFGTACSAPASAFGVLMRHAQAHLGKLRKTSEGTHYLLQKRLEEVSGLLPADGFPRTLTLQDQALFALGYYQQRAAGFYQKEGEQQQETEQEE
ncbi:MAG: type I-C CRISPR-associated protein Cas8c/Csd1 [Candidatus Brocadiia bacterium]